MANTAPEQIRKLQENARAVVHSLAAQLLTKAVKPTGDVLLAKLKAQTAQEFLYIPTYIGFVNAAKEKWGGGAKNTFSKANVPVGEPYLRETQLKQFGRDAHEDALAAEAEREHQSKVLQIQQEKDQAHAKQVLKLQLIRDRLEQEYEELFNQDSQFLTTEQLQHAISNFEGHADQRSEILQHLSKLDAKIGDVQFAEEQGLTPQSKTHATGEGGKFKPDIHARHYLHEDLRVWEEKNDSAFAVHVGYPEEVRSDPERYYIPAVLEGSGPSAHSPGMQARPFLQLTLVDMEKEFLAAVEKATHDILS